MVLYFFLLVLFCFCFVIISVPPQFIKTPNRVIKVTANSLASVSCQAFGFPPPIIVWSRGLVPLPQGRSSVINGTLNISSFSPQDVGPYQCKATNRLGSVTALTTLRYVKQGKDQLWMNVFYTTMPMTASNGNRTEWSPIRSVIIRVITKSGDRAAGVRFVYHDYDYRQNWTTRRPIIN